MITEQYNQLFNDYAVVGRDEAAERAKWMAEGIMESDRKSKGRDYSQVYKNTLDGVICEMGIASLSKGKANEQKFVLQDRDTYAWDVLSAFNHKLEVKKHKDKWFSFYPGNILTMLNNISSNRFDYIVTASWYEALDHYVVYPRLLINPKTFQRYISRSNFNTSCYYNHRSSAADNQCIIFNEDAISRLQNTQYVV